MLVKQIDIGNSFNRIDHHARMMADEITALVREQKIDTNKLVILIGETHNEVAHDFFSNQFIPYLTDKIGLVHFVDESPSWLQEKTRNCRVPGDWTATFEKLVKAGFWRSVTSMVVSTVLQTTLIYHAIDLNSKRRNRKYEPNTQAIPQEYIAKLSAIPFFESLFKNNRWAFMRKNLHSTSQHGLLHRNVYMAARIDDIMRQQPGPAIGIFGSSHLVDRQYPSNTAIVEMLLYLNYNVIAIKLGVTNSESSAQFEAERLSFMQRLTEDAKQNYLAHYTFLMDPSERNELDKAIKVFNTLKKYQSIIPEFADIE